MLPVLTRTLRHSLDPPPRRGQAVAAHISVGIRRDDLEAGRGLTLVPAGHGGTRRAVTAVTAGIITGSISREVLTAATQVSNPPVATLHHPERTCHCVCLYACFCCCCWK